ncbi:LPXTG cell wall anchor domain-containing protein [Trueperella sp.]
MAEADAPKLPKTGAQSLALGAPAMLLLLAGGGLVARRSMAA